MPSVTRFAYLWLSAAILMTGTSAPATAAEGTVTVLRGSQIDVFKAGPKRDGSPTVLRGQSAKKPAPKVRTKVVPDKTVFTAGSKFWMIDPETGMLTGCIIQGSGYVGLDKFRCTTSPVRPQSRR